LVVRKSMSRRSVQHAAVGIKHPKPRKFAIWIHALVAGQDTDQAAGSEILLDEVVGDAGDAERAPAAAVLSIPGTGSIAHLARMKPSRP